MALCALAANAQEKAMHLHRADGTETVTRVAELSKITFLSIDDPGKGLTVGTAAGASVAVSFEDQPVVTVAAGKLRIASAAPDSPVEIEIDDITEIRFGNASTAVSAPGGSDGVACVLQPGAALFRGIAEGMSVSICTVDGRSVPVPAAAGGEMTLSRQQTGPGIYIVRIGSFTTKITL